MDILKSLTQISTDYSFFEKDQVLTHDQLNSITGYLDDQYRLTRVKLLGVGIACGLRISMNGGNVGVTKGMGITTDGDLLHISTDTIFDKFKLYDQSKPIYSPFYTEGEMITVYELIPEDTDDTQASLLNLFNSQTGNTLDSMVAVLFMESYKTDRDICSGTDCDNLGQDCINNTKLLLVDKASAGLLKHDIVTPHQAFSKLNEVAVARPLIASSDNSLSLIAKKYRSSCTAIHGRMIVELGNLYPCCSSFIGDIFASDPASDWNAKLVALNTAFASIDSGIQYYYDFMKDIAETYNNFCELLFGNNTWCCPDINAFPKHLLLGNLVPGPDPDENYAGFYPSPVVSRTAEQLNHAKFLARKLDTLIQTFQVPASAGVPIRVTPSMFEDQPMEERAIPYYYPVNTTTPIHKSWSYRLHERNMDNYNYSYHAGAYGAQGGAANPLTSQIGRFTFFRIEGHLGQNVSAVLSAIENEIQSKNLPFAVRAIMFGAERTGVVKKPGIRYTDLHRFHDLLRQDVVHQLDEVAEFSGAFKKQVNEALTMKQVDAAKTVIAENQDTAIKNKVVDARMGLDRSYSSYQADATFSWKNDLKETMDLAGGFKSNLSDVIKTDFTTPIDRLIGSTHIRWLDWIDEIIKQKEGKEDEQLLFTQFISQHPGIEHFAGVVRGGTFILVYDNKQTVVADFMLPYLCCDTDEEEPKERPFTKLVLKLPDKGIKVLPPLDTIVSGKLDEFKVSLKQTADLQKDYLNVFKDSVTTIGNVFGSLGKAAGGGTGTEIFPGAGTFADPELNIRVNSAREQQLVLTYLQQRAKQPDLTEDKRTMYETQAKGVEMDLAVAINNATRYVAESGKDVSVGSEGLAALTEISKGIDLIKEPGALDTVKGNLNNLKETAKTSSIKIVLGNMMKG